MTATEALARLSAWHRESDTYDSGQVLALLEIADALAKETRMLQTELAESCEAHVDTIARLTHQRDELAGEVRRLRETNVLLRHETGVDQAALEYLRERPAMPRADAEELVNAFGKATLRADANRYSGWCDDLQIARGKQDQARAALLAALTGDAHDEG